MIQVNQIIQVGLRKLYHIYMAMYNSCQRNPLSLYANPLVIRNNIRISIGIRNEGW